MSDRILGRGKRRRRRLSVAVVAALAALGVFALTSALAVHDQGLFELIATPRTLQAAGDDWDTIFENGGNAEAFTSSRTTWAPAPSSRPAA